MGWETYRAEGVVGDVRVLRGVAGRVLYAYLPPSHGSGRRLPALYLHDGQNLFDAAIAHNGAEWRVDETMEELAGEGLEAVVVGITVDERRSDEYAGEARDAYLALVVDTVKPLVEAAFEVDPSPQATGIAGSSLGGIASLYAIVRRPDVFGFAGVFSPAFWWSGDDRFFELVEDAPELPGRIYLDVGDDEGEDDEATRRAYVEGYERMRDLLVARGLGPDRLRAVLDHGGVHHETAWARRLPDALRFLLPR